MHCRWIIRPQRQTWPRLKYTRRLSTNTWLSTGQSERRYHAQVIGHRVELCQPNRNDSDRENPARWVRQLWACGSLADGELAYCPSCWITAVMRHGDCSSRTNSSCLTTAITTTSLPSTNQGFYFGDDDDYLLKKGNIKYSVLCVLPCDWTVSEVKVTRLQRHLQEVV